MSYLFYLIPREEKEERLNRSVILNDEKLEVVETLKNEGDSADSTFEDTVKHKDYKDSVAVIYSDKNGDIQEIGWHSSAYAVLWYIRMKYGFDWIEGDEWLYEMCDRDTGYSICADKDEEDIMWAIYLIARMANGGSVAEKNDPLKDKIVEKYGLEKIRETVAKYKDRLYPDAKVVADVFCQEGDLCGKPIYEYLQKKWEKREKGLDNKK